MKSPYRQQVRLGDVCQINPQLPDEIYIADDTQVSFLPMASVDEVFGDILEIEQKTYQEVKKGFTPFIENDILFAKITPSMENGKATVARNLINGIGFGSTEFHVIRCSEQVLPDFIFYFIRQTSFRLWAKSSFIGSAGQQRVPAVFLARVPFLLPTIPEQEYIVQIFKQTDTLRREWWEILNQAKGLPGKLFLEFFGVPQDYLRRWGTTNFGSFVTYSKYGPRFPHREYSKVGARILRTTDMEGDGSLRWWESPIMALTTEEELQHALQPGTLLVSRSGTIGPIALFSGANEPCIAGAYLIEFGLSSDVNHRFIVDFFLSDYGQAMLTGGSQSMTQANLNAPTIKKILVPTPPRELQDQYEQKADEIKDFIRSEEEVVEKYEMVIANLIASGFTGELTQSWCESHWEELELWIREHAKNLPQRPKRVGSQEVTPLEGSALVRSTRHGILEQLSRVQKQVYSALTKSQSFLIPSEDLDRFLEEWLSEPLADSYVEDIHDHILRALNQLAGLGLITRVGILNRVGEYITGYRALREEELTKARDLTWLRTLS